MRLLLHSVLVTGALCLANASAPRVAMAGWYYTSYVAPVYTSYSVPYYAAYYTPFYRTYYTTFSRPYYTSYVVPYYTSYAWPHYTSYSVPYYTSYRVPYFTTYAVPMASAQPVTVPGRGIAVAQRGTGSRTVAAHAKRSHGRAGGGKAAVVAASRPTASGRDVSATVSSRNRSRDVRTAWRPVSGNGASGDRVLAVDVPKSKQVYSTSSRRGPASKPETSWRRAVRQ